MVLGLSTGGFLVKAPPPPSGCAHTQCAGADPGGSLGGQDPPPPFWGTPKLHKEGGNAMNTPGGGGTPVPNGYPLPNGRAEWKR